MRSERSAQLRILGRLVGNSLWQRCVGSKISMHLYAISKISDLLILDILKRQQKYSGDLVLIAFSNDTVQRLEQYGLHAQLIQPSKSAIDYHGRYLGDNSPISGTLDGMPHWKLLGIDRLNFWFDTRTVEILSTLKIDSLTISLDIYDVLVWQVANIAKSRGVPVRAIQTHSVRVREMCDLLQILPIDELIVSYPADDLPGNATVVNNGTRPRTAKASGAPDGTVVLFDRRDEYQFRRLLSTVKIGKFTVFPIDTRSDELYYRYLHNRIQAPIIDNATMLKNFKQVIMFRFDDDLIYKFVPESAKVLIYDFGGINLAKKIVRESDKNIEVVQ